MVYAVAAFVLLLFFFQIFILIYFSVKLENEPLRDKKYEKGITYGNFLLLNPALKITLNDAISVLGEDYKENKDGKSGSEYIWTAELEGRERAEIALHFADGRLIGAQERGFEPALPAGYLSGEALERLAALKGRIGGFQRLNDEMAAAVGRRPYVRRRFAFGKTYWQWGRQERELVYRTEDGTTAAVYLNNCFGWEHYLTLNYWFSFFFRCDSYNDPDIGKDCVFWIADVIIEKR